MKVEAIDLFCGIGGFSYGLQQAGINVVAGIDNDPTCRKTYQGHHRRFIEADLRSFDFRRLQGLWSPGAVRVLVGSPSCQPFSALQRNGEHRDRSLIHHMGQGVDELDPDIFIIENVPGFYYSDEFKSFMTKAAGQYSFGVNIVDFAVFGLPQHRKRLIVVGSRHKLGDAESLHGLFESQKTVPGTVRKAIADLPVLEAGQQDKHDPLHRCQNLSPLNRERIQASKPGRTWREWLKELLPDCYTKMTGKSYGNVYGRMEWDKPAPTITTRGINYGSGRFGHPEQDRALSLLEMARLQGFPDDYAFDASLPMHALARQIGNAVPPLIGRAIGGGVRNHLEQSELKGQDNGSDN